MTKPRAGRRGFTLIEMLVTAAIITLVLTLTATLFQFILQHFTKTSGDLDAERQARLAMANVTDAMRQAAVSLTTPQPAGTLYPAILVPAIPLAGTPTPSSTVTYTQAEPPQNADYTQLVYDSVTISTSTPPPGHTYPHLIMSVTPPGGPTTTPVVGKVNKEIK